MSFENSSISWSNYQLTTMMNNGKIDVNDPIQRGRAWENARRTKLIESFILSVPVPAIYAERNIVLDQNGKEIKVYVVMDGKQRLETICDFLNDRYKLSNIDPVTYFNDLTGEEETVDISGKIFSQLPEGVQEKIKNSRLNVIYFDSMTAEEKRELFKRLNAGKSLTAKNKALASCKNLKEMLDIGKHPLFTAKTGCLTTRGLENKVHVSIIVKCWMMLHENIKEISFEQKYLNKSLEDIVMSDQDKIELKEIFDLIVSTHEVININNKNKKVSRKLYTETHMISLVPFFKRALNDERLDEGLMADWIQEFFGNDDGSSISEEYNAACNSGINKNSAIMARYNELEKSFNAFCEKLN